MSSNKIELHERIENVTSNLDLADFIEALREDLASNKDDWENVNLDDFLEAMGAWVGSMNRAYSNMGKTMPENLNWSVFADILLASKMYE